MQTLLGIALSNAVVATLLAGLAAVVSRFCRRPALVHGLWLLVFLKLVTPPLVPVSVSWLSLEAVPLPVRASSATTHEAVASAQPGSDDSGFALPGNPLAPARLEDQDEAVWVIESELPIAQEKAAPDRTGPANLAELFHAWCTPWLTEIGVPVWVGISLLWFGWTGLNSYRFQRLLRYARRAPPSLQDQARTLAAQMGLKNCPGVWLVPGAVSPMLWFVGRTPRLLFPAKLLDQLDREQRATLLVHELAHYRRRDHWLRLIEMLALGLYWWHPVAWWARHELHEAEEQCCDAWVVWTLAGADRAYATALLQTVAFISQSRCPLPAAASGIGQVRHLRRRLTMIMQGKTPRSLSWAGFLAVVGLGLLLLPVHAQAPRSETEQQIEKLEQAIKSLKEKQRAEKETNAAEKKASAEEIARAKAEADKLGRVAQDMREQWQTAAQRHQKALAHLAALEGKPHAFLHVEDGKQVHGYPVRFADGQWLNKVPAEAKPYVLTVPAAKADAKPYVLTVPAELSGKVEHRAVIARVNPDGKVVEKVLAPAGKGEQRTIILHVDKDAHYDTVEAKLKELAKHGGKGEPKTIILHIDADGKVTREEKSIYLAPKQDQKSGTFKSDIQYQYRFLDKDGKEVMQKSPPAEKAFRFNVEKQADAKGEKAKAVPFKIEVVNKKLDTKMEKFPAKDAKAAELERKIEQLLKEVQELKDALKRSREGNFQSKG
jgi:beta-lactamase regulating signal transducer with metallopeptidase domain